MPRAQTTRVMRCDCLMGEQSAGLIPYGNEGDRNCAPIIARSQGDDYPLWERRHGLDVDHMRNENNRYQVKFSIA